MDLATNAGFSNAVYKACTLREGGAALVAPVCSSWVFMRSGSMAFFHESQFPYTGLQNGI